MMMVFEVCSLLVFFSLTPTATSTEIPSPKYAKPRCNDTCGERRIPYPFGIGSNCSINEWYAVECISSTPYLSALDNHLEVLGINLVDQTVTVNVSMISDCQNPVGSISRSVNFGLDRSPFLLSRLHNKFVMEGCGNAVILDDGSSLSGCSTTCRNATGSDKDNCLGISCCETTIPYHLKSYSVNLTRLERMAEGGTCGSAFLVDKSSYDGESLFRRSNSASEDSFYVPISLLWTLAESDYEKATSCSSYSRLRLEVDLGNGATLDSWKCNFNESQPIEGNKYLLDGYTVTKECRECRSSKGFCKYDEIYNVDGLVKDWNFTCVSYQSYKSSNNSMILAYLPYIVILIMAGLGFIAIIYASYRLIKKRITRRRRKSIFKRINGRLLLKHQEEVDPSLVDKTILFTSRALEKATDNFNENRILGRGGQGTVYKGMLVDGRIVAVKKSKIVDESQLEQFINEVVILSQVNHRNVVKLLGCCLETEVPLLVSEFISNGTLYDRIHNETNDFPISLKMRLQIATEVAGALAYLHSATSFPIYHRDIKTTNILLDDKFRAKISDFGTSRSVSMDQTHLTTLVKGTFGYLDPEYFQSSQFTEKSDVYSFGVVLVELLTGERPISLTRFGENRSLATHFMLAMEEGRVMSIFDALVIKEGTEDVLLVLANLAMRCLHLIGKNRPTMKEVAIELETIRASHIPSMVQTKTGQVMYGGELSMLTYCESPSTFMSVNEKFSQ